MRLRVGPLNGIGVSPRQKGIASEVVLFRVFGDIKLQWDRDERGVVTPSWPHVLVWFSILDGYRIQLESIRVEASNVDLGRLHTQALKRAKAALKWWRENDE